MNGGKKAAVAAVALIAVAAVAAYCARVWYVNAHAQAIPVEYHEMGEQVDLDGNFMEFASENTSGYSVRVTGMRLMSPREYAQAYTADSEDADTVLAALGQDRGTVNWEGEAALDEKTEIVLDIEVTNKDNDEKGGIFALSWRVIPEATRDAAYQPDFDLWALASPAMGNQLGFSIRSGTSMTLHVPFYRNLERPPLKTNAYNYVAVADAEPYYLQLSNVPTRHIVSLDAW